MHYTQDIITIKEFIKEDILIVTLELKDGIAKDTTWQVDIFSEGKVIKQWKYSRETLFAFKLPKSDSYGIKVYAQTDSEEYYPVRKAVKYYTVATRKAYEEFMNKEDIYAKNPPLPLYCPDEPYQNIALVFAQNREKVEFLSKKYVKLREISPNLICNTVWDYQDKFVVSLAQQRAFDSKIIFSGRAKYDKKLIMGQADLRKDMNYDTLMDEIGLWSALKFNQHCITFTNDYFGMYRLFYYNENDIAVISNNYHLLLLILKMLDVKLSLNINEALPYFLKSENGLLEQRISHNMDISGIIALPIDKYVEIESSGIVVKDKSIHMIFNNNVEYSEEYYLELLKQATDEIKENVKIALNDERYKKIVLDLTGGKDSRTVFSAVEAVNGADGMYKEKIRINTIDISNDKDTAIGLSSIFGYKYDDLQREYKVVRLRDKEYRNRSFFMGTSYSRPCPNDLDYCPQKENVFLNITGAGESILRPYYSCEGLSLPEELFEIDNANEIFKKYMLTKCEEWTICTKELELNKILLDALVKSTLEMPGINTKDKINYFLPYFRNVYHFGSQAMMDSIEKLPQWQPLFTKSTFAAYRVALIKHYNIKFQIDLIANMCSIMAILPFEDTHNNHEVESLIDDLIIDDFYKKLYRNLLIKYSDNDSEWENAQELKKKHRVILNKEEQLEIDKENRLYRNDFYNQFLDMLRTMLKFDNGAFEPLGLDLFFYISRQKEKFEGKSLPRSTFFLFNKVASVVDEMMIIGKN